MVSVGIGTLLVWLATYDKTCIALSIPILISLIIGLQVVRMTWFRRRAYANAMFVPESRLFVFYNGRFWNFAIASAVSVLGSTVLLLNFIAWPPIILIVLIADAIIIYIIAVSLIHWRGAGLKPEVAKLGVQHFIVQVNSVFLLAVLFTIQFFSPIPPFVDRALSVVSTMVNAAEAYRSACEITDYALKIQGWKEGLGWWLILKATAVTGGGWYLIGAWVLLLSSGAISVWAYSRLFVELATTFLHGEKDDG